MATALAPQPDRPVSARWWERGDDAGHRAVEQAPQPFRFSAELFSNMVERGLLDDYSHIELRDGELIEMAPQSNIHSRIKTELGHALISAVRGAGLDLVVNIEVSVKLDAARVPEPDIVVCVPNAVRVLVPVELVRLAVEVSWSTIEDDLGWKRRAYAQAGIAEYWVADLARRQVLRFAALGTGTDGGYADPLTVAFGEPLPSLTIPGLTVDTSELLRVPQV